MRVSEIWYGIWVSKARVWGNFFSVSFNLLSTILVIYTLFSLVFIMEQIWSPKLKIKASGVPPFCRKTFYHRPMMYWENKHSPDVTEYFFIYFSTFPLPACPLPEKDRNYTENAKVPLPSSNNEVTETIPCTEIRMLFFVFSIATALD